MDLSAFVQNTMQQIVDGVVGAQAYAAELGAAVNPAFASMKTDTPDILGYTLSDGPIFRLHFDVAVTAKDVTGAEGGGKVQVAGLFSVGASAKTTAATESVSRLQFVVPLSPPVDAATKEQMQERARKSQGQRQISQGSNYSARAW